MYVKTQYYFIFLSSFHVNSYVNSYLGDFQCVTVFLCYVRGDESEWNSAGVYKIGMREQELILSWIFEETASLRE